MPANEKRIRPRRVDVRIRLLDAALEVFAERGFEGASMDQVAAAAGFTKGALYSNFDSKEELFLSLMDRQVAERVLVVDELCGAGIVDLAEIGNVLTRAALRDREWQLLFLDYWARAVRYPAVRHGFLEHRRRLRRHVADAAEALIGTNHGTSLSTEHLATLLLVLSNGLAIEGLVDPANLPEDLFGRVLSALTSLRPP